MLRHKRDRLPAILEVLDLAVSVLPAIPHVLKGEKSRPGGEASGTGPGGASVVPIYPLYGERPLQLAGDVPEVAGVQDTGEEVVHFLGGMSRRHVPGEVEPPDVIPRPAGESLRPLSFSPVVILATLLLDCFLCCVCREVCHE